jgi:Domain of unknown function (DUF2357)/PD-(D/E)XK nuclease superfamily
VAPLIEIDAPGFQFTLDGPVLPARGRVESAQPIEGTLRVAVLSGQPGISTRWRDMDGSWRTDLPAGPPLYEETSYTLTVVATDPAQRPIVRHRDPTLIRGLKRIRGRDDVITGAINFRSQVGRTRFEVVVGDTTVQAEVEVFPAKLDYRTDYEDLLAEVEGAARALVLEYLRATQRSGAVEHQTPGRPVDWLILLRNEAADLERALNQIVMNPHRELSRTIDYQRAERIRRPTPLTRRAVQRGQGRGEKTTTPSGLTLRSQLPAAPAVETLDTPENRWLRIELDAITRTVADLRSRATRPSENDEQPEGRAAAIDNELRALEEHLAPFLAMSPLADATGPVRADFASLTLLGAEGYREAYQSILRLRMALRVHGETIDLAIKDISELYEIWCYLAVVRLVADVLDVQADPADIFSLDDTGVQVRLRKGTRSSITLPHAAGRVRVAYNCRFRGLTGAQTPDVVIEIIREDMPTVILVLDAKYRLDASEEYVSAFGGPSAPIEAINQLHRYRDAIVLTGEHGRLARVVVRGVALFPLGETASADYMSHRLYESLGELGVGALPFLPRNQTWVSTWIRSVIEAPNSKIAWPGPPFSAWESLRSRS